MLPYIFGGLVALAVVIIIVGAARNREQHHSYHTRKARNQKRLSCEACGKSDMKEIPLSCGHGLCKDCLAVYVVSELLANTMEEIKCPITDCNSKIKKLEDCKSRIEATRQNHTSMAGSGSEEKRICEECWQRRPLKLWRSLSCGHGYCIYCLVVRESEANPTKEIKCPITNCDSKIKLEDCKSRINDETFSCEFCKKNHSMKLRRSPSCDHDFCKDCLAVYVASELFLNPGKEIECPMTDCKITITQEYCKSLLEAAHQKSE